MKANVTLDWESSITRLLCCLHISQERKYVDGCDENFHTDHHVDEVDDHGDVDDAGGGPSGPLHYCDLLHTSAPILYPGWSERIKVWKNKHATLLLLKSSIAKDNETIRNLFRNYIEKISTFFLFDLNFQLIWSHQNLISLANHKMRPWTEIWWNQSTKLEIRLALMKSINNQPHEFGHTLTRKFQAWHSTGCPKKGDFQNGAGAMMHRLNHL